jgi:hypothetical protein
MTRESLPHVLIIDDEDTTKHELGLRSIAATRGRHPRDVEVSDIEWADLVLMDFIISNWAERDELEQVSLKPLNGLALAAVLREHADAASRLPHSYTAFAIHSAHIGDIAARLHTTNRTPYVVARLNNLEWAFDKADTARFKSSAALAEAVSRVSKSWPTVAAGAIGTVTAEILQLSADEPWSERAEDDLVMCQIPRAKFSAGANGLLFLRWLLHGIMPYPTVLLAMHWVAARLRITVESLRQVMHGESEVTVHGLQGAPVLGR